MNTRRLFMLVMATLFLALPLRAEEGTVALGEDGLHKPDWIHFTFKDMTEDLEDATAQGKRFAVIFEQRGCIYCTKMHNEVFPDPDVNALIKDEFYFVQMNLFGDEEVVDFDGTVLTEKAMARRWGVVFTPTILFMPETVPESGNAARGAVAVMPGAFGRGTTFDMLKWVTLKGYDTDEHFQKYHARMINERRAASE